MMNQWITQEVDNPYGSNVWKAIRNQWQEFWGKVIFVGDGRLFSGKFIGLARTA